MKNDSLTHSHNFGYFVLLILTFSMEKVPCIHCFLTMLATFGCLLLLSSSFIILVLWKLFVKVDCVGVNI